jgi:phosphate starvation-inducible PhoH-like protein
MNVYRVFVFFVFFIGTQSFKPIINNQISSALFVKKSKNSNSYLYTPKNTNQEQYICYLNNDTNKIIITTGPAGTGKTLLACQKAITQMKGEEIDKIIITRPVVTIEEDIGFLPGNINKKMDPWTKPIFDIFMEYYSKTELDMLINNGKIEVCPLLFMRGRTFKNAFIIADEMQNSSPNQMKMLVTRLGVNSRIVITGDLNQTDIIKENGLHDFITKVESYNNTELIKIIRFNNNDIERSEIVKKVIEIYSYIKLNSANKITSENSGNSNFKQIDSKLYNKFVSSYNNIINNDAALIPKQHITSKPNMQAKPHTTHNHDIFFESREF